MGAASLPDLLEGHRYKRLTTFRRSGETVSTPLCSRQAQISMAMAVAVFLGGGDLGVKEAAISAMIMTFTFTPSTRASRSSRFLEALIGGGTAILVNALVDQILSSAVDLIGGTGMDRAAASRALQETTGRASW